jgi:primary-amine oxidase
MTTNSYPVDHPLDPLAPGEIETTRDVLEEEVELTDRTRYIEIDLDEPTKEELRRFEAEEETPDRRAPVVVRDKENKATY